MFWKNPGYKDTGSLKKDIECDTLIVGGGITGVSIAYFLQKRNKNKRIVLIEKNRIAGGATGRAAGILTPCAESDLKDLIKIHGKENGLIYYYHLLEALHQIKHIIKKEKIDCDFEEEPTIYAEQRHRVFNKIIDEYEIEKKLHMKVKLLIGDSLKKEIHTQIFKHGIHGHRGYSINPLKFTQNLSKIIRKRGVKLYEHTPLIEIKFNAATTPNATIKFTKIILATDIDIESNKIIPIKSTIAVSQRLTKEQLNTIGFPHKDILWDAKLDFNYLKFTKDNRILSGYGSKRISRGEDKISFYEPHLKEIKSFLKEIFPDLNIKIEYAWSGTLGLHLHSIHFAKINFMPLIKIEDNKIKVLGTAGQVPAVMVAKYVSNKVFNKNSLLDKFFS